VPRKLTSPPTDELVFAMKPPQGVRNYRKKIRTMKRKTRNPTSEIKIGLFILKLECNAGLPWPRRTRRQVDPKLRAMRLENHVTRVVAQKSRIQVPITAWRTGRTDLYGLVKGPPSAPGSPVGVRVKSELKMVTETCTASVTCVTTAPRYSGKVKAETRTVTAETKSVPVRTMPITPTVARVKQETPLDRLKSATVTNLMSPEMQRVRMEIGPQSALHTGGRDDRNANFISPRKRFMREFDNGSPSAKNRRLSVEHRLSTDSLGSTSDRSSPYRAPHSPHRGALSPGGASPRPSGKVSNFSIDSIMGGGGLPKPQLTPSRAGGLRSPSHHMPVAPTPTRPSPTPTKTPPPASPFASLLSAYPGGMHPLQQALLQQQLQQQPQLQQALLQQQLQQQPQLQQVLLQQQLQQAAALDPRIAQLAGLVDPRLQGLSPDPRAVQDPRLTPGSAYPFSPDPRLQALFNPYGAFSPFTAASVASSLASQSPGGLWTPPIVTTASSNSASSTPPPTTIAPPRQFASSPQHPSTPTSSHRPEGPGRPPSMPRPPSSTATSSAELAARLASPVRGPSPAPSAHHRPEPGPRPLDFLLQRAGAAQQAVKPRSQDNEGNATRPVIRTYIILPHAPTNLPSFQTLP
jgi:hypothetical protein